MLSRRQLFPLLAGLTSAAAPAQNRPNILLILADDLGQECLGCYGGQSYRTPNLDRLAAQGVKFTHAYAQPLCTPTRVELMTGQQNFRNWVGFGLMRPTEKTFGHLLQHAGYRTAIAGKWQFYSYERPSSPRYRQGMLPEQSGFDEYLLWHDRDTETKGSRYADPVLNENGRQRTGTQGQYGPDLFADFACQFMQRNRQRPFFLYYPMVLTHGPFNPTPKSTTWTEGNRLEDNPKHFADMVAYMDEEVGRLLKQLDQLGLRNNTLVLFYGDNGSPPEVRSQQNGRTVPGGKGLTLDSGMRVPLLADWPGVVRPGTVCEDFIDATDFLPTLAQAAGLATARTGPFEGQPVDGRSFLPQLRGQKGQPRPFAFSHYDPHPGCKTNFPPTRLVWNQQYKLYLDGRLFAWRQDPEERTVLDPAKDTPAIAKARKQLQAALAQINRAHPPKFNRFETDGAKAY